MSDAATIGQFEQLVLTAILGLEDNAYGVSIHARVEELSQPKAVSLGAVYATLGDRMGGEIHALALKTLAPEEAAPDEAA